MVRSYKITTEITVHTLSAPGTWLPNRDDVYLTIELFNQVKRTRLTDPIFPLVFHDRFAFEKVFWTASDPIEVTEMLEDFPVVIELRQVTDVYLGGALLAYFDSSARDLLSPYPSTIPRLEKGRELIMCRTVDFTGISPKMEFTTYTIIEEYPGNYLQSVDEPFMSEPVRPARRPRSAARAARSPSPIINGSYERQTVSSALRSRSPSPCLFLGDSGSRKKKRSPAPAPVNIRPPFVVRKVDANMLLRKPKMHDNYRELLLSAHKKRQKKRSRSVSPSRMNGASFGDFDEDYVIPRLSCDVCNLTNDAELNTRDFDNVPPEPPKIKEIRTSPTQQLDASRRRRVSFSDTEDEANDDLEVANINQRSTSPQTYYPSLCARYSPLMESFSNRIRHRVHESTKMNSSPLVYSDAENKNANNASDFPGSEELFEVLKAKWLVELQKLPNSIRNVRLGFLSDVDKRVLALTSE